jgi:hypothetical protein
MLKKDQAADDPVKRLAEYWFRAKLMHELLHYLCEEYDDDLDKLDADGHAWGFTTYLSFWLSGLFVVVEGFNKLKLKDLRLQKLFKENLGLLKEMRHDTFHFSIKVRGQDVIRQLNWAEELHAAIGQHLREYFERKAHVESILEIRAKARKKSGA